MKIFLTSAGRAPDSNRYHEKRLRELWAISSKQHELVDEAFTADLVLVGNIAGGEWFSELRNHPAINRFPEKCFCISDSDVPMPLLRGIYTSAGRGLKWNFRYRSAAYNLFTSEFRNPLIDADQQKAFELPKTYLGSFIGRDSSPVRLELFKLRPDRDDLLIQDSTQNFQAFTYDGAGKNVGWRTYRDVLLKSKFAICPRGVSPASMRLFEAMRLGVAPVILSDNWIFPKGPDWKRCALVIPEKFAANLEKILEAHEPNHTEIGAAAYAAYQRFFADRAYFDYLVDQIIDINRHQIVPEVWFWKARNLVVRFWKFKQKCQSFGPSRR